MSINPDTSLGGEPARVESHVTADTENLTQNDNNQLILDDFSATLDFINWEADFEGLAQSSAQLGSNGQNDALQAPDIVDGICVPDIDLHQDLLQFTSGDNPQPGSLTAGIELTYDNPTFHLPMDGHAGDFPTQMASHYPIPTIPDNIQLASDYDAVVPGVYGPDPSASGMALDQGDPVFDLETAIQTTASLESSWLPILEPSIPMIPPAGVELEIMDSIQVLSSRQKGTSSQESTSPEKLPPQAVSTSPPIYRQIQPRTRNLAHNTTNSFMAVSTLSLVPVPKSTETPNEGDPPTKRKRSISPYTKRADIPANHVNCFQLDWNISKRHRTIQTSRPPTELSRRTKSAKVCLRCRDQKDKCDGTFPCQNCRRVASNRRLKIGLPCVDADFKALNGLYLYGKYIPGHDNSSPSGPCFPMLLRSAFPRLVRASALFSQILTSIFEKMGSYICSHPTTKQAISFFSHFASTGIPAYKADSSHLGVTATIKLDPPPPIGVESTAMGGPINLLGFLAVVLHQDTIARMLNVEREALDLFKLNTVSWILKDMTKLLEKARRGKISADEKIRLGQTLVTLLFMSEMREIHLLESAEREFREKDDQQSESELVSRISSSLGLHIALDFRRLQNMQQCTRHLLRKLFGGSIVADELYLFPYYLAVLSGTKIETGLDKGGPGDDTNANVAECRTLQAGFLPYRDLLRDPLVDFCARNLSHEIEPEEVRRRLDHLACNDLTTVLPRRPIASDEWLIGIGTKELPARYMKDPELNDLFQTAWKRLDLSTKQFSEPEIDVGGIIFKYLVMKWIEGE